MAVAKAVRPRSLNPLNLNGVRVAAEGNCLNRRSVVVPRVPRQGCPSVAVSTASLRNGLLYQVHESFGFANFHTNQA